VVSDHALYVLRAGAADSPQLLWRAAYDRGPARKPGQFAQGSGTTPTFFGPTSGAEYVAIVDNASPLEHLLVYSVAGPATPVCALTLPAPTGYGTEASPIGSGRSVFVSSTYGYTYPALPAGAGPSVPPQAPITGGMTRVDLDQSASGCHVVWTNRVRSSALPKLSLRDRLIYTFARTMPLGPSLSSPLDVYQYTVVSPDTGAVLAQQPVAVGTDTLQMAGTLAPGGVLYQGFVGGILRVAR
jgi:hypothetical protein